jgi:hypothetical protein
VTPCRTGGDGTSVDRRVAASLIDLFAGRDDAYNTFHRGAYVTHHRSLTPDVIVAAVRERRPVGAFFLTGDSLTQVGAIDFDRPDGLQLATRVGAASWAEGAPAYAEPSRDGRAHLWIVLEQPIAAGVLRRALAVLLAGIGGLPLTVDPRAVHIELRPAQDRLSSPTTLGSALRLPTMPHPITGIRFPLLDPRNAERLGRRLGEMLDAIEPAPVATIEAVARRFPPVIRASIMVPRRTHDGVGRFDDRALVMALGGDPERGHGVTRCPSHEDKVPSLSWRLTEDHRALLHCFAGCSFDEICAAAR